MVIDKKLNLDKQLEYCKDGDLIFSQNIVVSDDGLTIQNEPAIAEFVNKTNFALVGFIACNEEFVLFSSDNTIIRINKQGVETPCDVNWKWEGGDVFGTFTYNVNNDLIVAISERNVKSGVDVPLKIINLNKPSDLDDSESSIYTLTPNIPKSNMINVEYVNGNKIKKGKYNFFIKYFINEEFETAWFPIGIPVFVYDNTDADKAKNILNHRIEAIDDTVPPQKYERYYVSYSDFYNEDSEYSSNNLKLTFEINDSLAYTHYKIGYIINTSTSTEGRMTYKFRIKDTTIIINELNEPVSVDELTIGTFNLYNVNTMCNYKNRLYLANYKEENNNININKIDTSGIKVYYDYYESNIPEITSPEGDIKKLDYSQVKNQWKPKPGRAALYNFFIHYVYPNGNYTDGIPISNISNYEDIIIYGTFVVKGGRVPQELTTTANSETLTDDIYNVIQEAKITYGDTEVYELYLDESLEQFCLDNQGNKWFDVKYNWIINGGASRSVETTNPKYLVELENFINSNGDILYQTPITSEFNASKLYFTGIKMYPEFVGYFISYEEPEYIQIGEGLVIPSVRQEENYYKYYDLFDVPRLNETNASKVKFYYPEFSIVGGKSNVDKLIMVGEQTFGRWLQFNLNPLSWNDDNSYRSSNTLGLIGYKNSFDGGGRMYNITKSNIIAPDSVGNEGSEGFLELNIDGTLSFDNPNVLQMYLAISNNKNIYLSKNKKLISLGYTKFQNYENDDSTYTYGYEDLIYNFDFYRCYSSILFFDNRGIIINETTSNPLRGNGITKYYSESDGNAMEDPHIGIVKFWHETHYPLFLKEINQPGETIFYTYYDYDTLNKKAKSTQYQYRNLVLYPQKINDLYKLNPAYYSYTGKLIINYDKNAISNKLDIYNKTIRRSDVLQSESINVAWRYFRPENYKIITENKGDIKNIVGIGNYLFAHCEHSLFLFDITDSLQALDKNVQLLQPDSFDVNYKEVFTSDKGYAGIQDYVSWICDEFGYIFYDASSKNIYRFDGGQLKDITEGINNFIKYFNPEHIWIGNDRERNRILFNLRGADDSVIFSYNIIADGWSSIHSYISNYEFIGLKDKLFIPSISDNNLTINQFDVTKFNQVSLPVGNISNDDSIKSFVDVIFTNSTYNKIKVLDFITYILNKEPNDVFELLQIELYTNCCYSGVLDISEERKKVSEYKKPYYDFERWNFNYFRNVIDKIENGDIVHRLTGAIQQYPIKVQRGYDNALISGKYVVVRFSFKNTTKQINIKDIQCYFKP